MEMTVLVERIGDDKYRASTGYPVVMESEGHSSNEAVERLREQAAQRLKGTELVQVSIPGMGDTNPWLKYAGIWKDHPDFEVFLDNVAEYRRTVDEAHSTR
ncbi:MAG: hypothetical protein DMF61_27130 [Blastocatellia bacterium AA13]|nr:MAG: hypothetical protein DMF61_27130 [Blastocatellia bacterium AA13]